MPKQDAPSTSSPVYCFCKGWWVVITRILARIKLDRLDSGYVYMYLHMYIQRGIGISTDTYIHLCTRNASVTYIDIRPWAYVDSRLCPLKKSSAFSSVQKASCTRRAADSLSSPGTWPRCCCKTRRPAGGSLEDSMTLKRFMVHIPLLGLQ